MNYKNLCKCRHVYLLRTSRNQEAVERARQTYMHKDSCYSNNVMEKGHKMCTVQNVTCILIFPVTLPGC